jgi:tetratricopeptide (TPR) repeat protein
MRCFACKQEHEIDQLCAPDGDASEGDDRLLGRIINKRYRLERLIDRGGTASVYSARRLQLDDLVAVKILKIGDKLSPVALKRFRLEAAAAASIKHQNVVSIYDFGILEDIAYLVMELLDGPALSKELSQCVNLPLERASCIFNQVCAAVDAAHRKGIIHRDIKPSNIIFQHADGEDDLIKVVDFGIAKLVRSPRGGEKLTVSNIGIGTPFYMSPEQCLGQKVDERSDIYSLGVLLYQMLSGKLPFYSPVVSATLIQHAVEAPQPLSDFNPAITEEISTVISTVVMRALEKFPEKRFQSASKMAEEFEKARGSLVEQVDEKFDTRMRSRFFFNHFVGRKEELSRLRDRFNTICKGSAGSVFIIGDPGAGKTELVNQFRRRLNPNTAFFLNGSFYEYGNDNLYRFYLSSIYNLIRNISNQPENEDLLNRLNQIIKEINGCIDIEPSKTIQVEEQIKYRTFNLLTEIFLVLSAFRPVILFLDDVQWADSLSLEFLAYLLRNAEASPLLVLCTARSQDLLDERRPIKTWLRRINRYTRCEQLRLAPLSDNEVRALISSTFGNIIIPEGMFYRLYELSEGNPFYLGEILRQLAQEEKIIRVDERWQFADTGEVDLPCSILDLIELHLRRLDARAIDLFTCAAVAGERFSLESLHAITNLTRNELMGIIDIGLQEFIIKESNTSESGGDDYFVFHHNTLRRVLYDRLSTDHRRDLHTQIGNRLERLYLYKHNPIVDELAYHFYNGANFRKALLYSVMAGDAAQNIFSIEEALKYYTWADESLNYLSESGTLTEYGAEWIGNFRLSFGCALMHFGKNESAYRQFESGLELSRQEGLARLQGRILRAMGELSWSCSNYRDAIDFCEAGQKLLNEAGDVAGECRLFGVIGDTHFSQGNFDEAIEYYNKSLDLARMIGDRVIEAEALRRIGSILGFRSQTRRALDHLEEALAISRSTGNRQSEWLIMMVIGNIYLEQGRLIDAVRNYQQARMITRSIGRRRGECRLAVNLGEACLRQGDLTGAKNYLNEARVIAAEIQDHEIEGHTLSNLGLVYQDLGELDNALESFQQALSIFRDTNYHSNVEVEALSGIAEILLRNKRSDEAKIYFELAVESGKKLGLWLLVIPNLRRLAEYERSRGELPAAWERLREALSIIESVMTPNLSELEYNRCAQIRSELLKEIHITTENTEVTEENNKNFPL